ncbi:hypothetical protein AQI88_21420 [Streptomyces cellostaticus]|uniref:Thioesterase domain-containing protein n=1 Tax=Streptomyces cellostaticus TaxID=67285 RepID=A0A101NJR5_9ACTN|nr:hotdog fold domain-containing protein [Streptomyces cellostaticus]KUM94509.1 hypothetical protein AQI88_21420 [Streptomyces cellostaticus]GHI07002.1 hypothetical protein Scel_53230 [Streptomyces cellostaticus]
MTRTDTIPPHITGYPNVAFGGYVAGLVAARSDAETVRVDFRAAVPVGVPVRLEDMVTVTPSEMRLDAPEMPAWAQAQEASEAYLAQADAHPQPFECYGCSPLPVGKGIRLFPAPVPGRNLVAAAWVPDPELAGTSGTLPPEIVWSALDCPGGWAGMRLAETGPGLVTAALTGTLLREVKSGERHISWAWVLGGHARKVTVGVALATAEGELCALAEAVWVKPRRN